MKAVGDRIAAARRSARLSQVELARASGTSQPAIARYERGHAQPSAKTLQRIMATVAPGVRPSERLRRHREEVVEILRRHGATKIYVFGSVARGEDIPGSDIDILVDRLDPETYSFLTPSVQHELEELLGCPVDIGEVESFRKRVLLEALTEARPL